MSANVIYGCGNSHNLTNEETNKNQFQIKMHFHELNQKNNKQLVNSTD